MKPPDKKPRLLVVDDEVEYCSLIQEYFSDKYDVCVSYDGEQAMTLASHFRPDCILLDLKMPKMDGMKVLKLIKASYPKIKVIMISASGSIRIAEETIAQGAFDYILKPIDLNELEDRIATALKKPDLLDNFTN